jgi:endonuclease YncB( thermonuclease family)
MIEVTGYCDRVEEGDKLLTSKDVRIRLARVCTPDKGKYGYEKAKSILEGLVLHQKITYKKVSVGEERLIAEVWCGGKNVNNTMISYGYGSSAY